MALLEHVACLALRKGSNNPRVHAGSVKMFRLEPVFRGTGGQEAGWRIGARSGRRSRSSEFIEFVF
jgi:hypothetical protein